MRSISCIDIVVFIFPGCRVSICRESFWACDEGVWRCRARSFVLFWFWWGGADAGSVPRVFDCLLQSFLPACNIT